MLRFLSVVCLVFAPAALAQSLDGLWDAAITANGQEIPFRMEFSGAGSSVKGSFFNGEEKVTSASGLFQQDGGLFLNFDSYDSRLVARLHDGVLEGTYGRDGRPYPFHARRHTAAAAAAGSAPSIGGLWDIEATSAKGEKAWRFIVRQSGGSVSAAILRVDGDTGTLEGVWKGDKFVLSHFDGARPNLLLVTPQPDGTLKLVQGTREMTAVRPTAARAQGLPEPTDPSRHTTVRDLQEPFQFRFADLDGRIVSSSDQRFRGKVVIVAVSGSWCPNCHDEAPFLEEMYRKYRGRGLEVVALSFEEGDQLANPTRLRAFIKEYGIDFTVLVPGEPADLNDKLPQAVNLNSWPTTFFLGRDGRVRAVHAGFPGRASGEFHDRLRQETAKLIEGLLAENATAQR
jgi:peroxiredoxin